MHQQNQNEIVVVEIDASDLVAELHPDAFRSRGNRVANNPPVFRFSFAVNQESFIRLSRFIIYMDCVPIETSMTVEECSGSAT